MGQNTAAFHAGPFGEYDLIRAAIRNLLFHLRTRAGSDHDRSCHCACHFGVTALDHELFHIASMADPVHDPSEQGFLCSRRQKDDRTETLRHDLLCGQGIDSCINCQFTDL